MQYKEVAGGICAPKGFAAAGVHCGIRANHNEKYDLALIKAEVRCAAAGVYTTNKVCGAPIKVDRAHLKDGYAQAILVNSGNANTCAANGVALAEECCALVGEALHIPAEDVLPASTGVIGQPMVIDPFARGIPAAAAKLAATAQGSTDAATAIMTTDTHKKEYAIQFELGGKTCTVGAIGKGSGMIAPNMATMLAFYTTDAAVSPALLEKALKTVVPGTYNQMSVDLDTSTNDTVLLPDAGDLLKHFLPYFRTPGKFKVILAIHTDDTGNDAYLRGLSEKRIVSLYDYFDSRAKNTESLTGYPIAADDPLMENNTRDNRAANRRLEIYLMPDNVLIEEAKRGNR